MNIRSLVADDDAVSPVIGVILMVAVTVILAAVIGAFVLGIGSQVTDANAPSVSLEFGYENIGGASSSDDVISVTHGGGDEADLSALSVSVNSNTISSSSNSACWVTSGVSGSTFTSGDVIEVDEACGGSNTDLFGADDTARVVWTNPDGGSTAILGEGEVTS